jgi:type II secretory pathway pseudopilin PulG
MKQHGFTIIEITLAAAYFGALMLFILGGFLQINRTYTKGVIVKETQNATRTLIAEIGDSIRSGTASTITSSTNEVCVGDVRYAFNNWPTGAAPQTPTSLTNDQGNVYNIVRTTYGTCSDPILEEPPSGATVEMLPDTNVLQHLTVTRLGNSKSFRIEAVVTTDARSFPDDFLSNGENARCDPVEAGPFCDVAKIVTVVTARN